MEHWKVASTRARLSAAAAAAALAFGAAACGSDDDDGNEGGGSAAKAADTSGDRSQAPPGGPRAAYARFTESIYSRDYATACELMTAKHRREVVGQGDCAKSLRSLFRGQAPRGGRPKVIGMKVEGDTATLRTKSVDSFRAYPIEFVREDGEWKVNKTISGGG